MLDSEQVDKLSDKINEAMLNDVLAIADTTAKLYPQYTKLDFATVILAAVATLVSREKLVIKRRFKSE